MEEVSLHCYYYALELEIAFLALFIIATIITFRDELIATVVIKHSVIDHY